MVQTFCKASGSVAVCAWYEHRKLGYIYYLAQKIHCCQSWLYWHNGMYITRINKATI